MDDETTWTADRLRNHAASVFRGRSLVVVSNRGPYQLRAGEWVRTVGGMAAVLEPMLQACGGTWIVQGAPSSAPGPIGIPYRIQTVPLTADELSGFYDGCSNQALWPLLHSVYVRPVFDRDQWGHYEAANRRFAETILKLPGIDESVIFVQDYHLALVPQLLRHQKPRLPVAQFFHVPWPAPEALGPCPWAAQLLRGILGCDLVGFNTLPYVTNFLSTAAELTGLAVDFGERAVKHPAGRTLVRRFPAGVDAERLVVEATDPRVDRTMTLLRERLAVGRRKLVVSVDRSDYTKGVAERLAGIGRLFSRHPELAGTVVFAQVLSPSREAVAEFRQVGERAERLTDESNRRFGTADWSPIRLMREVVPQDEILALYRMADVAVVTPLRDGMNLVAKEFVACRTAADGVLVLSRFAGAAHELRPAIQVNPYDPDDLADGLAAALQMSAEEQRLRMSTMKKSVFKQNVYRWAAQLLATFEPVMDERMVSR